MGFGAAFNISAVVVTGIVLANDIHDKYKERKERKGRELNRKTSKGKRRNKSRDSECDSERVSEDLSSSGWESINDSRPYSSNYTPPPTDVTKPVGLFRSLNISTIDWLELAFQRGLESSSNDGAIVQRNGFKPNNSWNDDYETKYNVIYPPLALTQRSISTDSAI